MCLPLLGFFIEFLPYICLVTLPFFGSFGGIELILRLSLIILVHTAVGDLLPRSLYYVIPYLNLGLLTLIITYLPLSSIPYVVVWLYDKILWISDPVLLAIEVVLVLNFVMHCSRRCAEKIEEEEEGETWKWKLLLTIFSAGCYAILAVLLSIVYKEGSNIQFWMTMFVLCFSFMLAAHNMMWMSHEGIISDVAFVTLGSMVILYTMKEEVFLQHSPLPKPTTWYTYARGTVFHETSRIIHTSIDNAHAALLYLRRFLSPLFLVLLGIRLYSILFLIHRVIKNFELETEESYLEEFQQEGASWRSPFIVKCSLIFMITQFTTRLYYQCSGTSVLPTWLDYAVHQVIPRDLLLGRLFQVIVLNCFYIWRLYCADQWQWSDWFSA